MIGYDDPRREDGDEDRYEDRPSALCEACGLKPGSVSTEGAWLCLECDSALEQAEADLKAGNVRSLSEILNDIDRRV